MRTFIVDAIVCLAFLCAWDACTREAKAAGKVWVCDPPRPLEQGSGTVRYCHWK